ncbi:MAG TPA: hypothetical protein VEP90_00395 [Methylomirabilota bacterium]|nr:hypothetical protein [Methylomirabilota bacterium]
MKIAIFLVLLLMGFLVTFQAFAQEPIYLPPVKFDHPYHGKLTIIEHDDPYTVCQALGCQIGPLHRGRCTIHVPRRGTVSERLYRAVIEHETGHCNGWPGNHPGVRVR